MKHPFNLPPFMKISAPSILALAALSILPAHAAVLVEYEFTGDTLTPTATLAGITAGNFSAANTSGGAFNTAHSGPSDTPSYRMINIQELTPTDYFSFTTDATNASHSVTYETFDFYQNCVRAGMKYAVSYTISGGSEVFIADANATLQSGGPTNNMAQTVINFGDFTTAQSVEWRIYGYNATVNANDAFRVDDVSVSGVLIPEPTAPVIAIGFAGLLAFRRKRN